MKNKLFVLLLTAILMISLTACGGGGGAQSVNGTNSEAGETEEEEEEYTPSIPAAVLNLSEEDDILLNGELKDGAYINNYFGLKFTAPEGMSLYRLNDDATDTSEIIPLRQTYEDGYRGIMITTDLGAVECVTITIAAADDDKVGLSEEELVRLEIKETNELAEAFGVKGSSEYRTAVLAGEEHPVQYSAAEPNIVDMYFHIIKGDFIYDIAVSAPDEERLEYLLSFFEKF